MADRDIVTPAHPHALYAEHGYSPAVRANGLLFVSGQVGARTNGTPEPDLGAEVRLAFENLRGILTAAGLTFDDVVDMTLLSTDPDAVFPVVLPLLPALWNDNPPPALTAIGVTWLAGFRFEVKVIASLRETVNG